MRERKTLWDASIVGAMLVLLLVNGANWPTAYAQEEAGGARKVHVFIAGDSTASEYPSADFPRMGWGQVLQRYFDAERVVVVDLAKSGRSSKSFADEGWLDKIKAQMQAGDYLLIQFGHNDEKPDEKRHTEPGTTYEEQLKVYIEAARKVQAQPVLLTSVVRRKFENGTLADTHGAYPPAVRELAKAENVPLIDVEQKSRKFFTELGDEESKKYFLHLAAGSEYAKYKDGVADDTHFQERGAVAVA